MSASTPEPESLEAPLAERLLARTGLYQPVLRAPHSARAYLAVAALSLGANLLARLSSMALFSWGAPDAFSVFEAALQMLAACSLYAVASEGWVALAVLYVLNLALWSVNAIKIRYLDMPLLPPDFLLLGELLRVMTGPQALAFLASAVLPLGLMAGLLVRYRRRPRRAELALLLPWALLGGLLLGAPRLYVRLWGWCLQKAPYMTRAMMSHERVESLGPTLALSLELARYRLIAASEPSQAEVRAAVEDLRALAPAPAPAPGARPNIYLVLVESFFDPAMLPVEAKYQHLLEPRFEALWSGAGREALAVPVYGGGTANTEFEALCGVPAAAVSTGMVFQSTLANKMPCLPAVLGRQGYATYAFQAIQGGFYNWNVASRLLGFDRLFTVDDLPAEQRVDANTREEYALDAVFLRHAVATARAQAGGKPFLAYMMTYAGHEPFDWHDVYEKKHRWSPPEGELTDVERCLNINAYTSGLLADVAAEIRRDDPNALVVMAGDHMPWLALDLAKLDKKDTPPAARLASHQTPLLLLGPGVPAHRQPVAAYELPSLLLEALGLGSPMGSFSLLHAPGGLLLRPVNQDVLLASQGGQVAQCAPGAVAPSGPCAQAARWWKDVQVLGADLTHGRGYAQ